MGEHRLSDEYLDAWLKRVRVTHGSQTIKEAHEKLLRAGYTYDFEHAEYLEPRQPLPEPPQ